MAQDQFVNSKAIGENDSFFAAGRGWLIETIAEQKIPAQCNVHLALTEPGRMTVPIRTRTAP